MNTTSIEKTFEKIPDSEHEYIRKDLAQAMVAAAYEDAATYWQKRGDAGNGAPYMAPSIMRKRTPDDARAALEARDKRVRDQAMREAYEDAAISLLDRTRQQAPSDKMFEQMVADYERALGDFRALFDRTAEDT